MAIEVIDKIKQKNNGDFALMDAADIELADGSRLDEKVKELDKRTDSTLADGIAEPNVMYFLGNINGLSLDFPEAANEGDMIFVSFTTGDSVDNYAINSENCIGLSNLTIKPNHYYEIIGLWNGTMWACVNYEVSKI